MRITEHKSGKMEKDINSDLASVRQEMTAKKRMWRKRKQARRWGENISKGRESVGGKGEKPGTSLRFSQPCMLKLNHCFHTH